MSHGSPHPRESKRQRRESKRRRKNQRLDIEQVGYFKALKVEHLTDRACRLLGLRRG